MPGRPLMLRKPARQGRNTAMTAGYGHARGLAAGEIACKIAAGRPRG